MYDPLGGLGALEEPGGAMGNSIDVPSRVWGAVGSAARVRCRMRCLPLALVAALTLGVPAAATADSASRTFPGGGGKRVYFARDLSPAPHNEAFASSPLIATDGSPQLTPISDPFSLAAPRAHAASFAAGAAAVLKVLGEAAAYAAVGEAFGWVLRAAGVTDPQLTQIDGKLDAINRKLDQLQHQVGEIQRSIPRLSCDVAANALDQKASDTKTVWDHYLAVAKLPANNPGREGERAALLSQINGLNPVLVAQQIHNKLVGLGGGGRSLLEACGHAIQEKAKPFLTPHSSTEIQEIVDFWQLYEARLVTLRVEYLHATKTGPFEACPDPDLTENPRCTIKRGEENLRAEKDRLKPAIPAGTFLDTRSSLLWYQIAHVARNRADASDLVKRGLPAGDWHLPSLGELFALFPEGCCKPHGTLTPKEWLHQRAEVDWSQVDHHNWNALHETKAYYPKYGAHFQYNACAFGTYSPWVETSELPLVWTETQPSEEDARKAWYCDGHRADPFNEAAYGVALPLGEDPRQIREECPSRCVYPERFPGAAFGVRNWDKSRYLYP